MAAGRSDDIDADVAAHTMVKQCLDTLGGVKPKAGPLFRLGDRPLGCPALRRETFPRIELIGSTSSGEMSSEMGYQEDSVTLAQFASDDVDISSGIATHLWDDVPAAARSAVERARAKSGKETRLRITFPCLAGRLRG